MSHEWTFELRVPCRSEVLFAYLSDARNLDYLMPPWLHVHIITPTPVRMAPGTRIDYRLRLHGVSFRWESEITLWEPPLRFAERQAHGPFRSWSQVHALVPDNGGVTIVEQVKYAVLGGFLVDRLLVRPSFEEIFAYRARRLEEVFKTSSAPAVTPRPGETA